MHTGDTDAAKIHIHSPHPVAAEESVGAAQLW